MIAASRACSVISLAQSNVYHAIRESMPSGPSGGSVVLLALGVTAFVGLLIICRRVFREKLSDAEPVDHFDYACDVLELKPQEREDLRTIAAHAGLAAPASMLLSPQNLATALDRAWPHLRDQSLRRRIEALGVRLFDTLLPRRISMKPHDVDAHRRFS